MAKALQYPVNDVLQQLRIAALTTPPVAFEMSALDKEMGTIISRNDIPKDVKVKLYNEALNKFRDARHMYVHNTVPSAAKSETQKSDNIMDTADGSNKNSVVTDSVGTLGASGIVGNMTATDNTAIMGTPVSTAKTSNTANAPAKVLASTLKQEVEDMKNELQTKVIASLHVDNTDDKSGKIYNATPGTTKKTLGTLAQGNALMSYLLANSPKSEPLFGDNVKRHNNQLRKYLVAQIGTEMTNSGIIEKNNQQWRNMFPNLSKHLNTSSPNTNYSPTKNLRSRSVANHSGVGKIRVNFNNWNRTVSDS